MHSSAANPPATSVPRVLGRVLLGAALVFAGTSHLTFARHAFYAQIPPWLPLNATFVIIASGIVEIVLGIALVVVPRHRVVLGWAAAALFVVVFPGNVSQFLTHSPAFGLDSDLSRGVRLLFQPLLVVWALWCTGAWSALRRRPPEAPVA
ncbi:hypothetical protein H7K45_00655 [Mycobacterium yunnanensis]|uniref:DoxX family membrane protein n=1 Tax=Mycobacterium yunnanensis TaxID=368477 RepID=A0A9X3BR09_9MYCO|nr:hypothetical protein [Mycobacterium yunnanensis]MCV7419044.1 hypothetical protein [Mycobacterium yunnanensis]